MTLARRRVLAAYESDDDWAQRLRTALEALPVLLESEPERARLCLVHAPMAGAEMMMRCRAVVEEATRAIELSGASAISQEVSHVLVKHAVGEAYGLVHRRLGEEGRTTLLDLLPVLTRLLRAPFCGLDPEGLARPDGA